MPNNVAQLNKNHTEAATDSLTSSSKDLLIAASLTSSTLPELLFLKQVA